ncbi:hypothetical protein PENTCL1PPCAC_19290, partial [Pristionchus entomophagus]
RSASFRMCVLGEISAEHRMENGRVHNQILLEHVYVLVSIHQSDVSRFDRRGELGQIDGRAILRTDDAETMMLNDDFTVVDASL